MTALSTLYCSHGLGVHYGIENDKHEKAALGYDYNEKHRNMSLKKVGLGWCGVVWWEFQRADDFISFLSEKLSEGPRLQKCRRALEMFRYGES